MEHQLKHEKTFRYQELHASERVEKVLYVLHGYGQLVEFFIRKFQSTPEDLLIVAPEGMHRFYLNGTSGRVGASWMTKIAREDDIADTIAFLNELDTQLSSRYSIRKRYLFGFSQGGATAARWEQLGNVKFDGVILWACIFPPDLPVAASDPSNNTNHFFAIGTQDEFYQEDAQKELIKYYRGIGYHILPYEGTHDVVNETLTQIIRQIERKS